MSIVFYDPVCPSTYDDESLQEGSLGGTEATVVRVATALNARVIQHNRTQDSGRFLSASSQLSPSVVVVLRDPRVTPSLHLKFPSARLYLWLHDLIGPETDRGLQLASVAKTLEKHAVTLVCVSRFHAEECRRTLALYAPRSELSVKFIYNPLDPSASKNSRLAVESNKLFFASAPHKGLHHAVRVFSAIRRRMRDMRLFVSVPGYARLPDIQAPGITLLGSLRHKDALHHMATSLAVFAPNYEYPETFGLVIAESNAVGTPVLTHGIGAVPEVVSSCQQIVAIPTWARWADSIERKIPYCASAFERTAAIFGAYDVYERTLLAWRQGERPIVSARPEFKLDKVAEEWRALLSAPS